VFHADITGLSVGVIDARSQFHTSFLAKAFEFIADLINWDQLKPPQGIFVNLFMVSRAIKKLTQK
jgi:hypothetical protein